MKCILSNSSHFKPVSENIENKCCILSCISIKWLKVNIKNSFKEWNGIKLVV